jgi:hypothetical protein
VTARFEISLSLSCWNAAGSGKVNRRFEST